jgi:signal transduction histidine kinase
MRFRDKSIRRRIGALMLVPLLSLVSVWVFATAITVGDARQRLADSSATEALGPPTEELVHALQRERWQTLVFLGDLRRAETGLLRTQRATDEVADRVLDAAGDAEGDLGDIAVHALDTLASALGELPQLREEVRSNDIPRTGAREAYNAVVDPGLRLFAALQPVADVEIDRQGRAVAGLAQARELLAREDAMVAGALAFGRVTPAELRELDELIIEREAAYAAQLPELPVEDQQAHQSFWDSGDGRVLTATEQILLGAGPGPGVVPQDKWAQDSRGALEELGQLAGEAGDRYQARVDPEAPAALLRAVLVGVGGLAAVVLSAAVALRVGRRQLRELRTLSTEARDAAEVRLPGVMRRLAAGERVDAETEAPRLEYGKDDLGQVGQALNTLQRAALSAAVERYGTRRGVSEVFVNLARRGQVLLHRQLSLLETVERRTDDSGDRADLIRLAHLTSRMRRHADGLFVLSGAAPARQWGKPEQLMDLLRAAVDEVEDYERIELRRLPPLVVSGAAVADLTHLVAELLENATVFSPPHTAVQVSGERVPHGFILEIHDRGLGMTADALDEANQRLSEPADFELADTDRLGLFVVSRLAERHGVRVSLKDSPYGGTTAVTLIPGELLSEGERPGYELPEGQAPPPQLSGPMDGPVELEAPVDAAAGPAFAQGGGRPADADEHAPAHEPDAPVGPPQRRHPPVLVSDHGRPVGPPPGTAADTSTTSTTGTTSAGLPRRVRRSGPSPGPEAGPGASATARGEAAPERDAPGAAGGHSAIGGDGTPSDVDAEAVRTRMAALQRGWRRARQQTDIRQGETPPGP